MAGRFESKLVSGSPVGGRPAGLIRLLFKRNKRHVVIAVHERDLFDCLTLELSPACRGDELISIELGERATGGDQAVTRLVWAPDVAVGR